MKRSKHKTKKHLKKSRKTVKHHHIISYLSHVLKVWAHCISQYISWVFLVLCLFESPVHVDLVGYAENFVKGEDLRAHSDDEEAARCLVSRIFQRKKTREKQKEGKREGICGFPKLFAKTQNGSSLIDPF